MNDGIKKGKGEHELPHPSAEDSDVPPEFALSTYDFELPQDRIAQYPRQERDAARLLVVRRTGEIIDDTLFSNVGKFLAPTDCLVLNDSRVIKSRLTGARLSDGRTTEILLIDPCGHDRFKALVRNRKRFAVGDRFELKPNKHAAGGMQVHEPASMPPSGEKLICEIESFELDTTIVRFDTFVNAGILENYGSMPIPPYLKRDAEDLDDLFYQTVYAREHGSSAAPTAGLHFSPRLLDELRGKIFALDYVTLHVGWGTFSPIRTYDIRKHVMHTERFDIPEKTVADILETKKRSGRVVACGTTTLRCLEGSALVNGGMPVAGKGETDIFLRPGKNFSVVDALITNFHTPLSSLLVLVSAFCGVDTVKRHYRYALDHGFRFFSYGDAMLILP